MSFWRTLSALVDRLQASASDLDREGAVARPRGRPARRAGLLALPGAAALRRAGPGHRGRRDGEPAGPAERDRARQPLAGVASTRGTSTPFNSSRPTARPSRSSMPPPRPVMGACCSASGTPRRAMVSRIEPSRRRTVSPDGGQRHSPPVPGSSRGPSCPVDCRMAAGRCVWSRWTRSRPAPIRRGGGRSACTAPPASRSISRASRSGRTTCSARPATISVSRG